MRARVSLPALLLLESSTGEVVNIFPSGRMLLRKFTSKDVAREFVEMISPILI
ncbi:MAG: hypothetical protein ACXAB9_01145 [Candidatus Thorarchaeota archaeon]|jgi:hypothetical protein